MPPPTHGSTLSRAEPQCVVQSPEESVNDSNLPKDLSSYLQCITVKVLGADTWGSGILVHHNADQYVAITNHHVVFDPEQEYQVETWDGLTYKAQILNDIDYGNYDLRLITFTAPGVDYQLASLGDSDQVDPRQFPRVIAAGFPNETNSLNGHFEEFQISPGIVTYKLKNSIESGYAIGYSSLILKGMSGGPLINDQGELIAINGLHAYPLWEMAYIDDDGNPVPLSLQPIIRNHSWGIPINVIYPLLQELDFEKH